jgi:hypothetical protein
MKRIILAACFVVLTLGVKIAAQQVFGSATVQVSNQQTSTNLLAGKTPATFTSLAGWTLVAKGNFEGQGYDSERGNGGGCYCGPSGCFDTIAGGSHSNGTHAFETDVAGSEFDGKFGKNTSPASEYYVSG